MNAHFSKRSPGGPNKTGFLGNGQPVHPGPSVSFEFPYDPGQFRESWQTPLTAWLAKGNPLGPKK